ncbi:MAG TPA: GNAT family N-acetyltransferase [Sporichthya sp.]|nr:GNAT family N-acetyltransferase [Sporichthya sp.]
MPRSTPPVLAPGILSAHAQPTLVGDGVLLRPWEPADAPVVFAAYQDPDIQRWHVRGMADLDEAVAWVDHVRRGWVSESLAGWAVEVDDGIDWVLAGRVVLRFLDLHDGRVEVGYWVLPAARGRGVATRALSVLSSWALDELGLHRLELEHSVRNQASCRVAVRAGFELEGTRRAAQRHDDGWHDMHVHARLGA